MGPRPLVTVLIIKPGPVSKGKLVKILQLVMQEKFRVVGLRLLKLTEMQAVCLQPVLIRKVRFSNFFKYFCQGIEDIQKLGKILLVCLQWQIF